MGRVGFFCFAVAVAVAVGRAKDGLDIALIIRMQVALEIVLLL